MSVVRCRNLLLLLTANAVLLSALAPIVVEADFDPSKLFGNWGKKSNEGSKVKAKSDLVRELEDLEENISSQTLNRIDSSSQAKNMITNAKDTGRLASPTQQNSDQPVVNDKKVTPPRRSPPPPMPAEYQGDIFVSEYIPEELRGLIRATNTGQSDSARPRTIRPNIRYPTREVDPSQTTTTSLFNSNYLKKKIKGAYSSTKKSIISIPKYVESASDFISATMKLDKRGRILALIEELNKSMGVVRCDFSKFTEFWGPIMEQALNYVGATNLNKLKWNDADEFDFRLDALYVIASGYEFMRIMIAWRQNTLIAHAAYRLYLQTVKKDISSSAVVVDENFIYQLEAIHNYILFKSWLLLDNINLEPKMKFEYLSQKHDDRVRNYESDYFRSIIIFQELYEPTMEEFENERQKVIDSMSTAGAFVDEFAEVDEFIEDFLNSLDENPIEDIEITPELIKFMAQLKPEIQYNPQVYDKHFMLKLKEAKEQAMKELEQNQTNEE